MVMCKLVVLRSGQSAGPGGPDPLAQTLFRLSRSEDNEATVTTRGQSMRRSVRVDGQKGLLGVAARNNGVSILFETKTVGVEQ